MAPHSPISWSADIGRHGRSAVRGFRRWIGKRYFEVTRSAPSAAAVGAALNVIEARAQFEGPARTVHVRVAGTGDRIYLDLADEAWRCVEIEATGWRIIQSPPVRFRRSAGMLPLPLPVTGGSVDALRGFVNVRVELDFILVIAWLLAAVRDKGPYPLLVLAGEQGSAKTTLAGMLRALVDPNVAPLRALPRDDRDLFIAASNGHLLAFDNVSGLPYWLSDTLCRLATGGGFATRQLYTDTDEVLFDAARPIVLNGIEDMVSRPDLADRAIFLSLEFDFGGTAQDGAGTVEDVSGSCSRNSWGPAQRGGSRVEGVAINQGRTGCPAWRTLRSGLPHARETSFPPEAFSVLIAATVTAPSPI